MTFYDPSLDPDILAVTSMNGTTITFVAAKPESLNGKEFDVVVWDMDSMCIAVSEDYVIDVIHNHIRSKMEQDFGFDYMFDPTVEMEEIAAYEFMNMLNGILLELSSHDAHDHVLQNLDFTIKRILDGG